MSTARPSSLDSGSESRKPELGYARRRPAAASTPSAGPLRWPRASACSGTPTVSMASITVNAACSSAVKLCKCSRIGAARSALSASRVSNWAHRSVAASSSRWPCAIITRENWRLPRVRRVARRPGGPRDLRGRGPPARPAGLVRLAGRAPPARLAGPVRRERVLRTCCHVLPFWSASVLATARSVLQPPADLAADRGRIPFQR